MAVVAARHELLGFVGSKALEAINTEAAQKLERVRPFHHQFGDVILFYLAENQFNLVGRAPALNWVLFNAQSSGPRVSCSYDERSAARPDPQNRRHYRYLLQGPNTSRVIESATGRPAAHLKFFNIC